MALFYPSLDDILKDTMEKHTAGEISLFKELASLPDSFNVYFQPHINCAHPDVIIESKGRGVLIIEVKDWNMTSYTYQAPDRCSNDKYGYFTVQGSNAKLSTPFEQVLDYKNELYDFLSPELCAAKLRKEKIASGKKKASPVYGVVVTAVYFFRATTDLIKSKFGETRFEIRNEQLYYDKYTACWTSNDKGNITSKVQKLLKLNRNYTNTMHTEIATLLVPSIEWLEQTKPILLTAEQKRFAECIPGHRTRLLGTPGSGKTIVIAQKAINCYRFKREPVLILTYNIALKNYIHDKIAVNSRDMSQRERSQAFEILHLDQFLPQMLDKYELKKPVSSDFRNDSLEIDWEGFRAAQMQILREAKDIVKPYTTVLIDEAQDYKENWFAFIDDIFVADNADYLIVADEKQNVYGQKLDEQKLPKVSGFRGSWAKLKGNHRMTSGGYYLAVAFQQAFMKDKYELDEQKQLDMFSIMEKRAYCQLGKFDPEAIFSTVQTFMNGEKPISPNDICILAFSNEDIRSIDKCFRDHRVPVQTVSETKEMYDMLVKKHMVDEDGLAIAEKKRRESRLYEDLQMIRHVKRNAFNMNPGIIKISTIHSFKGWEINTIVLVINGSEQEISPEVIYTAITRTKGNLLILNCVNNQYHAWL